MIVIDDQFLFENPGEPKLRFAQEAKGSRAMWGPILEKAWAKVKGSYTNIQDKGYMQNAIRAIAGIPVFSYRTREITTPEHLVDAYKLLESAKYVKYIIGV